MSKYEEFKLLNENFNKWLREEDKRDVDPELLSRAQELLDLSLKLITTSKGRHDPGMAHAEPSDSDKWGYQGEIGYGASGVDYDPRGRAGEKSGLFGGEVTDWIIDLHYLVKDKYNRIRAGKFEKPPPREEKNYNLIRQKVGTGLNHFFKTASIFISQRLKIFRAMGGLYNMLSAANPFRKLLGEGYDPETGKWIDADGDEPKKKWSWEKTDKEIAWEKEKESWKVDAEAKKAAAIAKELEEFPFGLRNQYQIIREMLVTVRDPIFDDVYMEDLEGLILAIKTEYEENYARLMQGGTLDENYDKTT